MERTRHESRGRHRGAFLPVRSAQPQTQTTAEHAVVARHVAVAGGGEAGLGIARLNNGGFGVLLLPEQKRLAC